MKKSKFEKLVREGIGAIPKKFREKIDNAAIVIEDWPNQEQLRKTRIPAGFSLFGLYEGVPQTKRGNYGMVLPDKITIFKGPIERLARSDAEICEIVKNTVWHEIAHHFGIGEKGIRELEKKRQIK